MKNTKVTKTISNMVETKVENVTVAINNFVDMTFGNPIDDAEKREKNKLKIDLLSEYMLQTTAVKAVPTIQPVQTTTQVEIAA